jgi:ribosome-associated translation inhibitor RaiA
MTTSIRTELRLRVPDRVIESWRDRLARAIASQAPRATAAELRFTEKSGAKNGRAIRCALDVKVPNRPPIHVGETGGGVRTTFDRALAKLTRELRSVREIARERQRHPKKYFAASRERRG